MPIHINLLSEAQAAEELRRRDPVKRAIFVASALVLAVLAWVAVLQGRIMVNNATLSRLEADIKSQQDSYDQVMASLNKSIAINRKLTSLRQMATNRYLSGNLLNAMQQTTSPDIQLLRLKLAQSYVLTEEVRAKTNVNKKVTPGKPATSTEKTVLTIEAKDSSSNPGNEAVNGYKEKLSTVPFFAEATGGTNEFRLINLAPPQQSTDNSRAFVLFTLECKYPEVVR